MNQKRIEQRLKEINNVIPFRILLDRHADDKKAIAQYYRLNRLAYRLVNSRRGFVHMGISRGSTFDEDDFLEHARIISSEYLEKIHNGHILELAAGKAATTKYLAGIYKHAHFTGLDLPHGQLNIHSSQLPNLDLVEGDYHDLSRFAANSFDIIYIIEALCHAHDKTKVIKEVERILKPNGVFIIFDGYISQSQAVMSQVENLVADLIYSSMMVTKSDHLYSDLRNNLETSGFIMIDEENLSRNVLPSMKRLESKAAKYFKHPRLARLSNRIVPIEVTGNAVAAYLMPLSVEAHLFQYWLTVAKKAKAE